MSYLPEFKGPVEGYVVNFLKRNLWRVARTHDHEDAMQEAHLVFLRTAARYPMVDTPQHFMALFKTSWANEFHDLSVGATEARRLVSDANPDDDETAQAYSEIVGELDNDGMLAVMIRQAPTEVLMVLNLFLNAPTELLELARAAWRRSGRYQSDGDQAASRMLGLPPGSTPITTTKEYFGQDPV